MRWCSCLFFMFVLIETPCADFSAVGNCALQRSAGGVECLLGDILAREQGLGSHDPMPYGATCAGGGCGHACTAHSACSVQGGDAGALILAACLLAEKAAEWGERLWVVKADLEHAC